MRSLNQLQEDELVVKAKFAEAALIAAESFSRFVAVIERLEKIATQKISSELEPRAGKGKHVA